MSIANEIIRLQGAKSDIKDAIETQGVTVSSSAKLDVYDDYINQIGTKANSIQTVLVNTETDPDTEEEYEVYTRGGDVISGTKIPNNQYSGRQDLVSVLFPDAINEFGDYAFYNCSNLIYIPLYNITKFGLSAMQGATSLTSVNLGPSLTTIAANAFSQCNNLTNIEIPASCTSIGDKAFYKYDPDNSSYVASLTITINNTTPPILGSQVFYCTDWITKNSIMIANLTIYVPAESVSAYQSATNWSEYASKIQAIP